MDPNDLKKAVEDRDAVNAAAKTKPRVVSTTQLIHLLGGQIVIGTIERYAGELLVPKTGLHVKSPYEVFITPPIPGSDDQTNRVAIVKYGTAGGMLPMCGVDSILVGLNAVAIAEVPREMFDHYVKAMEQDRM